METLDRSDLPLPSPPDLFTPTEVSAAEQLVQLSGSSGASASSSSSTLPSSPRSVNAPPPPPEVALPDAEEEEEEEEEVGPRRRNKRYRSIAEIYAATISPLGGGLGAEGARAKRLRRR